MCSADAMILLGQGKESVEKFCEATLEVALLKGRHKKKTAERVKLASFTLPPSPPT